LSRLTTRELAVAALFTALLSVSAYIAIPVGSVPFTLQVYVVLLTGMALGPRLGALSVAAYLLLGLVAPVYSGGTSGLGVLFGPTGGYLFGFVAAAVAAGVIAGRPDAGLSRLLTAGLLGLVPMYVLGAVWLALQLHLTPATAVATGSGAVRVGGRAEGGRGCVHRPGAGQPAAGSSCCAEVRPLTSAIAWPRRRRLMRPRSYSPMKSVELPSR
jgi:biotin transport system substrate-specific component